MTEPAFRLERNTFGRLVLTLPSGDVHVGIVPVRTFPIAAPDEGLSLVGTDGHELAWIERLQELPAAMRSLIEEELAPREFTPVIHKIESVSSFSTPSTWTVETDLGKTSFVLKGEEDIRRLHPGAGLRITSSHGVQFVIRDTLALDKYSRKLLERFL